MNSNQAKENCETLLKIHSGKDYVLFTKRGNSSIRIAMQAVAHLGRSTVLYQEEGGWLTYVKYIEQAGLAPIMLATDDGLILLSDLRNHPHDSALLINSMAGYVVLHNMDEIAGECFSHDIVLVNDVAGSIGTPQAKQGDIIVGSFGHAKPVDLGMGGFIATSDKELFDFFKEHNDDYDESLIDFVLLEQKLMNLEKRRIFLRERVDRVKLDLAEFDIVHPEGQGLNLIVRFSSDEEMEKIISYCESNNLEFTQCPREIRILDNAISIEVKRLLC
jgi:hypothetical protein